MISTQLNITFISYFVKKINCISVFHRFFSKSVYVVDARVYVCVLHFELRSFAAVPSPGESYVHSIARSSRSKFWNAPGRSHPQTHARHLISYLKHLVLFFYFFWFVNKFILSHLAYDLFFVLFCFTCN